MRRWVLASFASALLWVLMQGAGQAGPPVPTNFTVDWTSVSWSAVDVYWDNVQGAEGYKLYFNLDGRGIDIPEYQPGAASGSVRHKWRAENVAWAWAEGKFYLTAYDATGETERFGLESVAGRFKPAPVYVTNWDELESWLEKWFVPTSGGQGMNQMQLVIGDLEQWGPFGTAGQVSSAVGGAWQEAPSDLLLDMPQVQIIKGQSVPLMDLSEWAAQIAAIRALIRAAMWLEFIYFVVRMLVPQLKV